MGSGTNHYIFYNAIALKMAELKMLSKVVAVTWPKRLPPFWAGDARCSLGALYLLQKAAFRVNGPARSRTASWLAQPNQSLTHCAGGWRCRCNRQSR
jgi:hypothetical protein